MFRKSKLTLFSLLISFAIFETVARYVLEKPLVVEIKYNKVKKNREKIRFVEQSNGFADSVFNFRGEYGIRLKPNIKATIKNHRLNKEVIEFKTNSLGLRAQELNPKGKDEYRVVVFGDSITIGDYLNYEDLYTTILNRKFEGTKKKINIINAGLPGASTFDEFYHYLELKDVIEADLVLLAMYLNDAQQSQKIYIQKLKDPYNRSYLISYFYSLIQSKWKDYFKQEIIPANIDPNWAESFKKESLSKGRNVKSGDMWNDEGAFDFEIYNAKMDFGLAWNDKVWENQRNIIKSFNDVVTATGSDFRMLLFPVSIQVVGNVENYYPQEKFLKLCSELQIKCRDVRPALAEAAKTFGREMYFDHCHFGASGNFAVANDLYEWLRIDLQWK